MQYLSCAVVLNGLASFSPPRSSPPPPPPAFAQQPEIEKLAAELALKLNQPRWAFTGEVKIVVVGFQGPYGESSQLGSVLAGTFATALLREASHFKVLDSSEFARALQKATRTESEALNRNVVRSIALEAGAAVFITGAYGEGKVRILLEVKATRIMDDKVLGEVRAKVPLSAELRRLATLLPLKLLANSEAKSHTTSAAPESVLRPGEGGVGYPECVRCEDPAGKPEARTAGFEGRVLLKAVITPEGNAVNIRVMNGAPEDAMSRAAVDAVRKWKFKPALFNGKPVPVEVTIEVNFKLR
jgi:TonB family protein